MAEPLACDTHGTAASAGKDGVMDSASLDRGQLAPRLVDDAGEVRLGILTGPIAEVNYRDYRLLDPFGRPRGRWARHFGFNQFQFTGGLSEGMVFGCAIADVKIAGTAFVYCYDPRTRRFAERSFRRPLAVGLRLDQMPEQGGARLDGGRNRIAMSASEVPRQRRLVVDLACGLAIDATLDEADPPLEPMRLCTRAGATGWVYARKTAGVPVRGTLAWHGTTYDLGALGVYGHHDWSAGYMRRQTFWNWGCLSGRLPDGRVVGLNVSCGVNETSFTENCFWLDGRLHKLDTVHFDYDRRDPARPWRLSSFDGRLRLEFRSEGAHAERVNAWILASNFNQLFGRYHGWLETTGRERIPIDGMLGYVESHYAKW